MKLTVIERIQISSLLPTEGSFVKLQTARNILTSIKFSEKEISLLEMKDVENGQISWRTDKEEIKEIDFSDNQKELIKSILVKLDQDEKLPNSLFDLYTTFVL